MLDVACNQAWRQRGNRNDRSVINVAAITMANLLVLREAVQSYE